MTAVRKTIATLGKWRIQQTGMEPPEPVQEPEQELELEQERELEREPEQELELQPLQAMN